MKFSVSLFWLFLICGITSFFILYPVLAFTPWTISGDSVFVDDEFVFISATPHTLLSSGYVVYNLTSKVYSGDVDLVFGFDSDKIKPRGIEYYFDDYINIQKSYTCDYLFNYTLDPNHFWCYQNVSYYDNLTESIVIDYDYLLNHSFSSGDLDFGIAYWTESLYVKWKKINSKFTRLGYDFQDMDVWYYAKGIPIMKDEDYSFRINLDILPSMDESGKYWFAIKPSSTSLQDAISQGQLYALDPWWNSTWQKKQQINITEQSNNAQINYQVRLNISFDSDMNSDWSDLRFLNGSEDYELNYYLWNTSNDYAYVDVSVNLTANSINTIYMYYDNSGVSTTSNGTDTYIWFDDFEVYTLNDPPAGWSQGPCADTKCDVLNTDPYELDQHIEVQDDTSSAARLQGKASTSTHANGKYMFYQKRVAGGSSPKMWLSTTVNVGPQYCINAVFTPSASYSWVEAQWNSSDKARFAYEDGSFGAWTAFPNAGDCGAVQIGSVTAPVVTMFYDQFALANFIYPEPTSIFGAEEAETPSEDCWFDLGSGLTYVPNGCLYFIDSEVFFG